MKRREQESAIKILRELMETCQEGETALRRAVSRTQKAGLKEFLGTEALQQALFIAELQLELRKLDAPAQAAKSGAHRLRGWKEITGPQWLPSGDDTVLLHCERGEGSALGRYLRALQSDLPAEVRELVERQHSRLNQSHDQLRQLREQLDRDATQSQPDHQERLKSLPAGRKFL